MNTVYVLLMLWGGYSSTSGITVVQQEFTSYERCESARKHLEAARASERRDVAMQLRAQGCFKK